MRIPNQSISVRIFTNNTSTLKRAIYTSLVVQDINPFDPDDMYICYGKDEDPSDWRLSRTVLKQQAKMNRSRPGNQVPYHPYIPLLFLARRGTNNTESPVDVGTFEVIAWACGSCPDGSKMVCNTDSHVGSCD